MYSIAVKFPNQKQFQTIDIHTGEQVNSWAYCTLIKTPERANQILEVVKQVLVNGVEAKVVKYHS